jgi:hypothetical protein
VLWSCSVWPAQEDGSNVRCRFQADGSTVQSAVGDRSQGPVGTVFAWCRAQADRGGVHSRQMASWQLHSKHLSASRVLWRC